MASLLHDGPRLNIIIYLDLTFVHGTHEEMITEALNEKAEETDARCVLAQSLAAAPLMMMSPRGLGGSRMIVNFKPELKRCETTVFQDEGCS